MSHIRAFCVYCFIAVQLLQLMGCSPKGPELIPAKGKISISGKPAGGIVIQFLPDVTEATDGIFPTSYAISNKDGTFELQTADYGVGAVPGPHRLILSDGEEERVLQGDQARPSRLSGKYAIAGTVRATVERDKLVEIEVD